MQQETFIVGNREFTCIRMNAFAANRLLLRIQKIVMPILGSLPKGSILDMDVKDAAIALSEQLDEKQMEYIVLPMFTEAKLYSVENKKFIKDAPSIDQVFTAETLFDMYELIWLVGRFQFAPFFESLMSRFGSSLKSVPKTPLPESSEQS